MKHTDSKTGAAPRKGGLSLLFLLAAAVCAVLGALAFREQAGIWRTVPVLPVCMILAAFLPVPFWQRALLFLIPVVALTAVEQAETGTILLLCLTAAGLFACAEAGVKLIRSRQGSKKALRILCGVLALCLAFALYAFVCGNPISALSSRKTIDAYIQRTYAEDGGITFRPITYRIGSRMYAVDASSATYPNETGAIAVNGPMVEDRFLPILEDQAMRQSAGAVASVLRTAFPHDDFTVFRISVAGFPVSVPHKDAASTTRGEEISYCIELSGKPRYDQMSEAASDYANALAVSGVPFRSVRFVSAQTFHTRYRICAEPYGFTLNGCAGVRVSAFPMRCADMFFFLQKLGMEDFLNAARTGSLSH